MAIAAGNPALKMGGFPSLDLVDIPGVPAQEVDARILPDVEWILKNFPVRITAAYAPSGHAAGGEHPRGLALDIVPDFAKGGTWADVDKLAHWARPGGHGTEKAPFRWVGWNGDAGHGDPAHVGKNAHLHLSWGHTNEGVWTMFGFLKKPDSDATRAQKIAAGPVGDVVTAGADVAGDAASAAAKAVVGALWDLVGADGARVLLYIAFVAGGAALAGMGVSRTFGVGNPVAGVAKLGRAAV